MLKIGKWEVDWWTIMIIGFAVVSIGTMYFEGINEAPNHVQQQEMCLLLDEDAIYSPQLDDCLVPLGDGIWKQK